MHVQLYPLKILSCGYALALYHDNLMICYAHCAFSLHFCILYQLLLDSWLLTVYGMEKSNRFVLHPCLILSGIMFLHELFNLISFQIVFLLIKKKKEKNRHSM